MTWCPSCRGRMRFTAPALLPGSQVNIHGLINFAKSEFLKKCVFPGLKCINCRMNLKQQYDLLYYCHIRCQGLFRRYLKKRSFCCVNVQYFELHWDFYACCQMQVDVLFLPWWVFCIEETINCQLSTINYIAALLSPRLFRQGFHQLSLRFKGYKKDSASLHSAFFLATSLSLVPFHQQAASWEALSSSKRGTFVL